LAEKENEKWRKGQELVNTSIDGASILLSPSPFASDQLSIPSSPICPPTKKRPRASRQIMDHMMEQANEMKNRHTQVLVEQRRLADAKVESNRLKEADGLFRDKELQVRRQELDLRRLEIAQQGKLMDAVIALLGQKK
jgi:hypothetical protein